jgi:hypothetical protein
MSLALAPLPQPLTMVDGHSQMYVNAPHLVDALVNTTILACPVLLTTSYPPTLIQLWGGLSTPTVPPKLLVRATSRSGMPSLSLL